MRLLFYCSSLEPGRDGVGDYVRLLAEACARQKHSCAIVALNDPFVEIAAENAPSGGAVPTEVRLPAASGWRDRLERVRLFRERFQPDWISLQLVPYAFHKKGILHGMIPVLAALTEGARLHIMFHELWLGAGRPSPWRFHLVGRVQSAAIRKLLRRLRPAVVTASNPVYATMLQNSGANATVLPLFGNVPIATGTPALPLELDGERADWWIGVFFGALPEEWQPEPFMGILREAARRAGKKVALVLTGRSHGLVWPRLEQAYGKEITFRACGEQPTATISHLLQQADYGVAASPWELIGKSGTVAAMLEHGLPVIVTRDDFHPFARPAEPPSTDPWLHRCDDDLENKLVAGLPRRPAHARVDEIAARLVSQLAAKVPSAS